MSAAAAQKLRIVAIPLSRPRRIPQASSASGPASSKLNSLTYYHFQISNKKSSKPAPSAESSASKESGSRFKWPEEGIVPWATQKAADTWAGFGKAEGGWKLKVYQTGEKLVDRLDFEELALKSIDPSLAPSLRHLQKNPVIDENEKQAEKERQPLKIPLSFPSSILSSSAVLSELRAYTEYRIPKHKRGFYFWMILSPFTAPFMIIPIIPNLPFFFCVWRSWSHYRAYRSSQYLQSLLKHDVIVPEANEPLDDVYKVYRITESASAAPPSSAASPSESESTSSSSSSTPGPEPKHDLLLTRDAVPKILDIFEIASESTAAADVYRAVEQARVRVESGRDEL